MNAATRRGYRLLTLGAPLRVLTCPLCGSLLVADAERQHRRVHAAQLTTDPATAPDDEGAR